LGRFDTSNKSYRADKSFRSGGPGGGAGGGALQVMVISVEWMGLFVEASII
jgi:hypothetical protein